MSKEPIIVQSPAKLHTPFADYEDLSRKMLVSLLKERDAEIERMKTTTYCAYCGQEFPIDTAAEKVSEHIHTCPKHPIAYYRRQIGELETQLNEQAPER